MKDEQSSGDFETIAEKLAASGLIEIKDGEWVLTDVGKAMLERQDAKPS